MLRWSWLSKHCAKCLLFQNTHFVAKKEILIFPEKGIFSKLFCTSQNNHEFFNDHQSLFDLVKKINNSVALNSHKNELIKNFNLSEKVFGYFQELSADQKPNPHDQEVLEKLTKLLGDQTLALLEAVFSGTCENRVTSSAVKCHGCGAILQSQDRLKPGFVSSEQMKMTTAALQETKCKRCSAIEAYDIALATTMKPKHFKRMVAGHIKSNKNSAVLAMVDLTDLTNETIPNLLQDTVHKNSQIILLGNKFDLFPPDSVDYGERIINILKDLSRSWQRQILGVHLISAKTGYGVENVITSIMDLWWSERDIYLIGAVNAGKSTLFNILLQSDLAKGQAMEYFKRATASKWPGTTLNTLRFPLQDFTSGQLRARHSTLLSRKELKEDTEIYFDRYATGEVERILPRGLSQLQPDRNFYDPFDINAGSGSLKLPEDQRWFNDTPGILNETSVLPLLNQQELEDVIPSKPYVPRIYSLLPNQAFTFGGLGRIEYLQGVKELVIFLFSTPCIPTVIAGIEETQHHFPDWINSEKLLVPLSMARHNELGSFHSIEHSWKAEKSFDVFTDVVFSSTGWASLMMRKADDEANIRISCLHSSPTLRTPLLSSLFRLIGKRQVGTPKYFVRKDYSKLFAHGKKVFQRRRKTLPVPDSDEEFDRLFN